MNAIKEKKKKVNEIVSTGSSFEGYTIEEIRFQRALVAMEAEFSKTKFLKSWSHLQESNPLSPNAKGTFTGKAGSLALKLFNGLNYLDYIMIGLSVFTGARKFISFFRKRKR